MTVYQQGRSVDTTGLGVLAPKDVQANREYIWEYWTPAITFAFMSAETLTGLIKGALDLEEQVKKVAPTSGSPPVKITGIAIDTKEGFIWVRGVVQTVPVANVEEAGVSPLAIFLTIGGIFAVIGAAVSLRYVYDVTGGDVGSGALDPCSNPGVANWIKCLARESKWFTFGFLFGVVALVVFLLIRFGPKGTVGS